MSKADRNFTIFILLFVLGFLGLGVFHYEYEWTVIRFPLLVGLVAGLLYLANLAKGRRGARSRSATGVPAEGVGAERPLSFGQAWPGMMWVLAIVPFVFLLGYVIGLPLYIFAYLKVHGQGWLLSGALSLGTLAVVYLGFVKILGVLLPVLPVGLS